MQFCMRLWKAALFFASFLPGVSGALSVAEKHKAADRGARLRAPWDVDVPAESSHIPLGATASWGSTMTNDMTDEAEWKVLDATADKMEEDLEDNDDPLEKYSMSLWGYANPVDAAMHSREVLRQQTQQLRSELPGAYHTCEQLGTPPINCTRALKIRARLRVALTSVETIKAMMPKAAQIDDDLHHSGDAFTQSLDEEKQVELALKQEAANDKQLWRQMDVESVQSGKYVDTQTWLDDQVGTLTKSVKRSAKNAKLASDRAQSFHVQMRGIETGIKLTNLLDRKTSGAAVDALREARQKETEATEMAQRATKLIHGTETWLATKQQADEARKHLAEKQGLSRRIQRGPVAQTLARFGGKLPEKGELPEESRTRGHRAAAGGEKQTQEASNRRGNTDPAGEGAEDDAQGVMQVAAADDPDLGTANDLVVAAALGEDAPSRSSALPSKPSKLSQRVDDDLSSSMDDEQQQLDHQGGSDDAVADTSWQPAVVQQVLASSESTSATSAASASSPSSSAERAPAQEVSVDAGSNNGSVEMAPEQDSPVVYGIQKKVDAIAQKTMDELNALEQTGADDMKDDTDPVTSSSVEASSVKPPPLRQISEANETSGRLSASKPTVAVGERADTAVQHFLLSHAAPPPRRTGSESNKTSRGVLPAKIAVASGERSGAAIVGAARFSPRFLLSHRNNSGVPDGKAAQVAADVASAATHARIESVAESSALSDNTPASGIVVELPPLETRIAKSIEPKPSARKFATEFDAARHVAESSEVLRGIVRDTRVAVPRFPLRSPVVVSENPSNSSSGALVTATPVERNVQPKAAVVPQLSEKLVSGSAGSSPRAMKVDEDAWEKSVVADATRSVVKVMHNVSHPLDFDIPDQLTNAATGAAQAADSTAKALEAAAQNDGLEKAERRLRLLELDSYP